jgi:hypothetical protein
VRRGAVLSITALDPCTRRKPSLAIGTYEVPARIAMEMLWHSQIAEDIANPIRAVLFTQVAPIDFRLCQRPDKLVINSPPSHRTSASPTILSRGRNAGTDWTYLGLLKPLGRKENGRTSRLEAVKKLTSQIFRPFRADRKCIPGRQRSLVERLIAKFFRVRIRLLPKVDFFTRSWPGFHTLADDWIPTTTEKAFAKAAVGRVVGAISVYPQTRLQGQSLKFSSREQN